MNPTPTRIPRKPNTGAPKFQSDPLNSTYRWEFFLTAGRAGNKVAVLDGYSKGMGFENTNKVELLYKKLINPVLPYLSRCDMIVVYEQDKGLPKDFHPKLLELYPRNFGTFGWLKETQPIVDYLKLYYEEYVHTGIMPPIEDRRKNVRQSFYLSELDHSKYQFNSQDELKAFCRSKTQKYSAQCMHGWYYRHADFQPELFENDITGALAHAKHEATTAEGAQAAVSAMHNKFKSNR